MALPKLNAAYYDLDLPYSKKTIQFRPFIVGEQKQLMIAIESRDEKQILSAMKQAIQQCTNNTIDVNTLPLFELEYLFLNIRMKSVGENSKIVLTCDNCQAENVVNIDLRNTEFTNLDAVKDNVIFLTDHIAVRMKMPSISLVQHMRSSALDEEKQTELLFELTVNCLDAVLDQENEYPISEVDKSEAVEFINSLNSEQFIKIQEWFEKMPALKVKASHKCEKCGSDMSQDLQGITNFF